jgi:hypothetical protein
MRTWTLTADMTQGMLEDVVRRHYPYGAAPGISGGRFPGVSVMDDEKPAWMTAIQAAYPHHSVEISATGRRR